jgi:SAM-dependent methyltransferase
MNTSYSFDRAADFYDATRGDTPETVERITRSILELTQATPSTRILEVGIGTGRIAAPLIARGLNVTGLDLAREMMNRLKGKFAAGTPLRLVQGDASALPFADATCDAGIAVHVFHVIAPWRQAIGELARVLRPNAVMLHSIHLRDRHSANVLLRDRWHALVEARGEPWKRPGASNEEAIAAEFQALGASVDQIEVRRTTGSTIPRDEIADIAHRVSSDTWRVSDAVLQTTVAELTEWARGRFGSLDVPVPEEFVFVWQMMRFDRTPLLPRPLRSALMRLIPILEATGASWAVGGSCGLALHGVRVEPHDIDLITDQDGAYRIGMALREVALEKQPVQWSDSQFIRSHRGLYQLEDVQIDVVGGGEFREGEVWLAAWPLNERKTDLLHIPGSELAVRAFTLENELIAYRQMQREAKVRLIEERLKAI